MSPPPTLWTIGQAAAFYHASPRSVRRWCEKGLVPAIRFGRRGAWRIRADLAIAATAPAAH